MEKDWSFSSEGYSCGLRAAAVLVKNGRILLQRDRNGEEYALPGGHVKIGETLEDCLIREIMEETGAAIRCSRLLWSEECFRSWNGKQMHTVSFYYLAEFCGQPEIADDGGPAPQKDNEDVVFEWIPVGGLRDRTVYPDFLKEEIDRLDGPAKHFVSRY